MAIQTQNDTQGEMSDINVTPLVDVMLVLLVVFIVTAPLMTQTVKVNLPKTEKTEPAPEEHITILSVTALGQAMLNNQPIALENLEKELAQLQAKDPELNLQLQADKTAVFDAVAKVMAIAQRSGVAKLSFVTIGQ